MADRARRASAAFVGGFSPASTASRVSPCRKANPSVSIKSSWAAAHRVSTSLISSTGRSRARASSAGSTRRPSNAAIRGTARSSSGRRDSSRHGLGQGARDQLRRARAHPPTTTTTIGSGAAGRGIVAGQGACLERAGQQLLNEERDTFSAREKLGQPVGQRGDAQRHPRHLGHLGGGQRRQLQLDRGPPRDLFAQQVHRGRRLRPAGRHDYQADFGRVIGQVLQDRQRLRIRPMHVLQHQHRAPLAAHRSQQLQHALADQNDRRRRRVQVVAAPPRHQHPKRRPVRPELPRLRNLPIPAGRDHRLGNRPEGDRLRGADRPAHHHHSPLGPNASTHLAQQTRLPHARSAEDGHCSAGSGIAHRQQRVQLRPPTDHGRQTTRWPPERVPLKSPPQVARRAPAAPAARQSLGLSLGFPWATPWPRASAAVKRRRGQHRHPRGGRVDHLLGRRVLRPAGREHRHLPAPWRPRDRRWDVPHPRWRDQDGAERCRRSWPTGSAVAVRATAQITKAAARGAGPPPRSPRRRPRSCGSHSAAPGTASADGRSCLDGQVLAPGPPTGPRTQRNQSCPFRRLSLHLAPAIPAIEVARTTDQIIALPNRSLWGIKTAACGCTRDRLAGHAASLPTPSARSQSA